MDLDARSPQTPWPVQMFLQTLSTKARAGALWRGGCQVLHPMKVIWGKKRRDPIAKTHFL